MKKKSVLRKRDLSAYWETVLWSQVWIAGRTELWPPIVKPPGTIITSTILKASQLKIKYQLFPKNNPKDLEGTEMGLWTVVVQLANLSTKQV